MTDIQASLGVSQLKRLGAFVAKRRAVVSWYRELLGENRYLILPQELSRIKSSWHLFVVRTAKERDRLPLYRHLRKAGIGANFHYPPVYRHPFYRARGYAGIALPVTEYYAKTALTLPLYPDVQKKEVAFVCAKIQDYFRIHGNC